MYIYFIVDILTYIFILILDKMSLTIGLIDIMGYTVYFFIYFSYSRGTSLILHRFLIIHRKIAKLSDATKHVEY